MKTKFLYNNRDLRDRRRELRNNSTEAEKVLWSRISRKQINGLRFLRQYSVGPYILDFYCSKLRLGIEIDGQQHKEKGAVLYDKERSAYLETENIMIIRFWNADVLMNIDGVLNKITPLKVRGVRGVIE